MQLINLIMPLLLIAKSSLLSVNSNTQCDINHPNSTGKNIFYLANKLEINTVYSTDSYLANITKTTTVNSTNKCSKKIVQGYKNAQCSYIYRSKPQNEVLTLTVTTNSANSEYSGDFCNNLADHLFTNNYIKDNVEPLTSCYSDNNNIINNCADSGAYSMSDSIHGLFVFNMFVRVEKPCHQASIDCHVAPESSTILYCDNKPVYKFVRLDINYTTQKLEQGCPVDYNTKVSCYVGSKIPAEEQVNSTME